VQVLAHILAEREAGRLQQPALVVVPTSSVPNWRDEVQRFAPDLRLAILHGAQREPSTSGSIAATSRSRPMRSWCATASASGNLRFSLLVLDEAQAIKNARSKSAEAARGMNAARKLAVTGTPLENHLGELWSLFDCALPGLLGTESDFARFYRAPIERHDDVQVRSRLHRRTAPFVLRRTKEQVAPELPLKSVIERRIELGIEQRLLYESRRSELKTRLGEAVQAQGFRGAQMLVLEALLRLRQICCDPRLVGAENVESAKLEGADGECSRNWSAPAAASSCTRSSRACWT
jgi:non-specific serine/threonine protein kinase